MVNQIGRYRLIRKIVAGNPSHGIPELWVAEDAGDRYYVKRWQRHENENIALRAMWNREVRGLMRLQGYPGANELFMRLRDMDVTDKHYYVVLDGGRRMLMSEVLEHRNRYAWLVNLNEVGRRRPLWEGLLRLAEALSILHGEGTLHRSIVPTSVFVGPEGHADFRLSGFEWSLRLSGIDGAAAQVVRGNAPQAPQLDRELGEYSTATDWFDFGLIAAEILGVPVRASRSRDVARSAVQDNSSLRVREKELILQLLAENDEHRLSNGDTIIQEMRNVVRELGTATSGAGRDLVIALRIGAGTDFQRTIEAVSKGAAPASDLISQRNWVQRDLRGDVKIIARPSPVQHFIVKGQQLEYRIRQWEVDGSSTWDVGFCERIESSPRVTPDDQYFSLGQRKLDVQLFPHVARHYRTIKDRAVPWDRMFPFRREKVQLPSHLRDVHDFFRITQQLDTVLTVAQICPVKVTKLDISETETTVDVTPFEEPERNELARHLGLSIPSQQLMDWFDLGAEAISADDEEGPKKDQYSFLDRRTIGSETSAAVWHFVSAKPEPAGPRYRFRAQGTWRLKEGRLYLARNHGGTLTQIRRRHKAIEEMRLHEGLLALVAAPRDVSRRSTDQLPSETTPIALDDSKLNALEALWKTQPSYAIQGPPGTGKTTLIQAFADRLFTSDNSSQILITAHSHHTVDDVRVKLDKLFKSQPGGEQAILVRLGANEENEHDVKKVASRLLGRMNQSDLAASAPEHLKARISAAASDSESTVEIDVGTMQRLVQDAANITFSTSNSLELAQLATRGRRFDWSIIEEAAKAHGFDMAIALQVSHRLLLLGDHHQLPPYNVRTFKDLLGDPLKVRKAIQAGEQFAIGLVDSTIADDDEGRTPLDERCDLWRRMVTIFADLFERSIEQDGISGPAATLTDQHRMHPHIAALVGKIFYPSDDGGTILKSPPETHDNFKAPPPYLIRDKSWLPDNRIVWCDVEWVQKEKFAEGEVDGLFVSRIEAELVAKILAELRPRGTESCEVQLLSPYNDQLKEIRRVVGKAKDKGLVDEMFKDPFDLRKGKRLGATVDEFQGSEADVVIVSLVRNNALVPWKSVGFLKESNRMNVLLSRARHKLIIVGSWDFFRTRVTEFTSSDDEHYYIGNMMRQFQSAERSGQLKKVPFAQ